MLYHLTARCILPKSEGGLEVEVVFIDTDYLTLICSGWLQSWSTGLSQSSEEAVRHCLGQAVSAVLRW